MLIILNFLFILCIIYRRGENIVKICGIICEYNPFHNGHALHIKKTRELLGEDTFVICVMSGNYTQRGEPAIMPKHLRAQSAILNGADLVIELPSAYSLMSAEGFAKSGIYILNELGVVNDISFGAETSDTEQLSNIADLLTEHVIVQKTLLEMKSGISYAAARERALYSRIKENANIISSPNNILGIEYIKALKSMSSSIIPHAIVRIGATHDAPSPCKGTLSASAIREKLYNKDICSVKEFMPEFSYQVLSNAIDKNLCLINRDLFDINMFTYLLRLSAEDFRKYSDVSEGLEHRIFKAIHSSKNVSCAIEKIKSKRYPLSRIRRIFMCAYLGIEANDRENKPEYARVLAFNENGRMILSELRKKSNIPIITKPAHIHDISKSASYSFEKEALSTDLYYLALNNYKEHFPGIDWRTQAVKL